MSTALTISNKQWSAMYEDLRKIQGMDADDAIIREWMAVRPGSNPQDVFRACEIGYWQTIRDDAVHADLESWESVVLGKFRAARPNATPSDYEVIEWMRSI